MLSHLSDLTSNPSRSKTEGCRQFRSRNQYTPRWRSRILDQVGAARESGLSRVFSDPLTPSRVAILSSTLRFSQISLSSLHIFAQLLSFGIRPSKTSDSI